MLILEICSTDKPIATVHAASAEDVDRAVQAAKAALLHPSWKLLPATERGQMMARLADLMEQNRELLASIDAWDNGMPGHSEARSTTPLTIKQGNRTMSPTKKTSPRPSRPSVTTAAGPTRHSGRRSTPRRRNLRTPSVSLSASWPRSFHGTILCPWQPGNWGLRSLVEIQLCSSPQSRRHSAYSSSPSSSPKLASRLA